MEKQGESGVILPPWYGGALAWLGKRISDEKTGGKWNYIIPSWPKCDLVSWAWNRAAFLHLYATNTRAKDRID